MNAELASRCKRWLAVAVLAFLLAEGVGLVLSESIPEAMAYDRAGAILGLDRKDLAVAGGGYTCGIIGRTSVLKVVSLRGPNRAVEIQSRKALHFLPWQVMEVVAE